MVDAMLQMDDEDDARNHFLDELTPGPFDGDATNHILQIDNNDDDDDNFGGIDLDGNDIGVSTNRKTHHQSRLQPLDPRGTATTPTTTHNAALRLHYLTWQYNRIMQSTTKCNFLKKFNASTFKTPCGTNLTEADAV